MRVILRKMSKECNLCPLRLRPRCGFEPVIDNDWKPSSASAALRSEMFFAPGLFSYVLTAFRIARSNEHFPRAWTRLSAGDGAMSKRVCWAFSISRAPDGRPVRSATRKKCPPGGFEPCLQSVVGVEMALLWSIEP